MAPKYGILEITGISLSNLIYHKHQACYQMAHETFIYLHRVVFNFEEGVACYFAAYYMKYKFNQPNWSPTLPSYSRDNRTPP